MPKLGELARLYEQVCKEEANYSEDLRSTLSELFRCLAIELGLDPKLALGLQLGVMDSEGNFRQESTSTLQQKDLSLDFAVRIALSPKPVPSDFNVTEWSLRKTREGIELTSKKGRTVIFDDGVDAAKWITQTFFDNISSFSPYTR